ncbi:MAG: TetR/AcrR family transcriptional regulator [Bacteroidetes bacterium]|nr:TetR/AcrR family transcriptional regulator [Bacteroidota bacterium]
MEDKKLHILKNVGILYLKFGIRSVTMDDVASEFGISKKTLYQYFNDKADLVSQVVDYYLENPMFDLNNSGDGNAIDRYFCLREHINKILKYFNNNIEFDLRKQYPKLYKKVHKMKREKIFSSTVSSLEEGMKTGFFREDLDVELIAKLQVGRMLFTLNPGNGIFTDSEVAKIELFDKVIEYHMHAICTEKGIKYFKQQLNNVQNEA